MGDSYASCLPLLGFECLCPTCALHVCMSHVCMRPPRPVLPKIKECCFSICFLLFPLQETAHNVSPPFFLDRLLCSALRFATLLLRFVSRARQNTAAGEAATGAAGVDRAGMAGNAGMACYIRYCLCLAFGFRREASMLCTGVACLKDGWNTHNQRDSGVVTWLYYRCAVCDLVCVGSTSELVYLYILLTSATIGHHRLVTPRATRCPHPIAPCRDAGDRRSAGGRGGRDRPDGSKDGGYKSRGRAEPA